LTLKESLRSRCDAIKGIPDDSQISVSRRGDYESLALAIEQPDAKLGFERLHLMADGTLGNAQLLCRSGEAFMPSRRLEGLKCIEWRQSARHPASGS
jgi:hypothetical protein